MSRRLLLHLCALIPSLIIIWCSYRWTFDAFYPPLDQMAEALEKPWRPFARLGLSAVLALLLLGTQALIAGRTR